MRIGVDATCWANGRGYGRYTRELVTAMGELSSGHEITGFLDPRSDECCSLTAPNFRRVVVPQRIAPTEAAAAGSARSPRDMLRLTRAVAAERPDVFFCPTVYSYFPLPPFLPAVVTIHDTIAERFPALTLPTRRARLFWQAKVGLARWQAQLVLTTSAYASRQIANALHVPAHRIRVVPAAPAACYREGPDPAAAKAARERQGLPPHVRYFIYVGGFNPHKHVDVLVRALADCAVGRAAPPHLVLVGALSGDAFHDGQAQIRRAIEESGAGSLVHWTGHVPDEELRHLHAGAVALVLPSAAEGFGLPAIEAAACGTPVVATTESPLPELLAGGGHFIPPGNQAALAEALATCLDDEADRVTRGHRARARALSLTWEASARGVLAVLEEAAA